MALLLQHGFSTSSLSSAGETPLHWAALQGHEGLVRLLLEHGADASIKDDIGFMAIDCAEVMGHESVRRLLQNWACQSAVAV